EGTVYTPDIPSYCGDVTATDCETAVPQTGADGAPEVINILAAFNPGNRLVGIVFGWSYSPNVVIEDYGACGDFELANADWPASGYAAAVTWISPQTEQLDPVYWAAAYSWDGARTLQLGMHPTQVGDFADDTIPAVLDQF